MVCAGSRAPEEASQATHAYHAIASSVERTSRGGCFCRGDAPRGKGRRPKGGHVANTVACVAIISLCTKVRAPPGLDPSASVQHRGFARTPLATVAKRKLRRVRSSGCGAFCARRSAGGRRSSSSCDCKHVFENFVYALIRCGSKQQDSPAMEHGTVNTPSTFELSVDSFESQDASSKTAAIPLPRHPSVVLLHSSSHPDDDEA